MRHNLDAAFRATTYHVELNGDRLALRIDTPCPRSLSRWIAARSGKQPAWIITACNPRARPLSDTDNAARSAWLAQRVARPGLSTLASVARADDGAWPEEPGLLIAEMEESQARALGHQLGQVALVTVTANAPIALLWLPAPASRQPAE